MVADLRKMQENQGVSENRIDKYRFGRKAAAYSQAVRSGCTAGYDGDRAGGASDR